MLDWNINEDFELKDNKYSQNFNVPIYIHICFITPAKQLLLKLTHLYSVVSTECVEFIIWIVVSDRCTKTYIYTDKQHSRMHSLTISISFWLMKWVLIYDCRYTAVFTLDTLPCILVTKHGHTFNFWCVYPCSVPLLESSRGYWLLYVAVFRSAYKTRYCVPLVPISLLRHNINVGLKKKMLKRFYNFRTKEASSPFPHHPHIIRMFSMWIQENMWRLKTHAHWYNITNVGIHNALNRDNLQNKNYATGRVRAT